LDGTSESAKPGLSRAVPGGTGSTGAGFVEQDRHANDHERNGETHERTPARGSIVQMSGRFGTTVAAAASVLLSLGTAARLAGQQPDASPNSEVTLVSEVASIQPGVPFTAAVRIRMDAGWHTYWINAGDSGLPLDVEWQLPPGFETTAFRWPAPERIPVAPLMTYGYENEVVALVELTPPADLRAGEEVVLAGVADYLVCAELCLPATDSFALTLPVRAATPAPHRIGADEIAAARARLPLEATGWNTRAWATADGYVLEVAPPADAALASPYFFADSIDVLDHAATQRIVRADGTVRMALARSPYAEGDVGRIEGILVADDAAEPRAWAIETPVGDPPTDAAATEALFAAADVQHTGGVDADAAAAPGVTAAAGEAGGLGLLVAIGFAFLGGLLLNLMPCVFPVLSIKALGIVEHAGGDAGRARRHGGAFAAGVILSFWLLAGALFGLRAAGQGLGWGFQLQSPYVVAVLAVVMFALALGLSGVLEIGAGLGRLGTVGGGRGYRDSFLTGGLAVVVASPCTAPFMGAGLGYALVQPPLAGMAVFTALAIGLAAPYAVLASVPGLLRRMPRPGAWMETLKQLLAFPLYATVVWLVWVFGRQVGVDGVAVLLLALTLVGLAAWIDGRVRARGRSGIRRVPAALGGAVAILVALAAARMPAAAATAAADAEWEPYSAERVEALRAEGRPVLIDFTAAWCLSCQVNERVALRTETARRVFAEADVALVKADWTSRDPEIAAAIESFGRSGVPLYVLYPADGTAPEILPAILTPGIVVDAVRRAATPRPAA
jgi:thiol:disulfide interchange protein